MLEHGRPLEDSGVYETRDRVEVGLGRGGVFEPSLGGW